MTDRERFESLIGIVLAHEGGYVNDPNDPGGETKYGISKRSYPNADIRNLTEVQARDIYYRDWWQRLKCDQIKDDHVAIKLLDTCVNVGAAAGVRLMQQALGVVGRSVAVDGLMGPQTIDAVNHVDPQMLLAAMRCQQAAYYRHLIERNPKLARFECGWMNRAYS